MRSNSSRPERLRKADQEALLRATDRLELAASSAREGQVVSLGTRLTAEPDVLGWLAEVKHPVYWSDHGRTLAGAGIAATIRTRGTDRFERAEAARLACFADAIVAEEAMPILLGGFAFVDGPTPHAWRGFPSLRMVLPAVLLDSKEHNTVVTLSVRAGTTAAVQLATIREHLERLGAPHDRAHFKELVPPSRESTTRADATWLRVVERTAADVRTGQVAKVVLARSVNVNAPDALDPARTIGQLGTTHPGARVFWIGGSNAHFVGATPELLVRVAGRDVRTAALAGSLPAGKPARALLGSAKDRTEHAIVIDAIVNRLEPLCDRVLVAARPIVQTIGYIQHLRTPVAARLKRRSGVLTVAGRLHPTPAIAGAPLKDALAILRKRERIERGWYGGGVGWIDAATGDGEFALAIRSALLRGTKARAFAGAGIVGASVPEAELAETEVKLMPVLNALGVAKR